MKTNQPPNIMFHNLTRPQKNRYKLSTVLLVSWAALSQPQAEAGSFIFANRYNVNLITHPSGYTGQGGILNVKVCIVPNSLNTTNVAASVKNSIAYWNKRQPTTANLRPSILQNNLVDFESVFTHELGHCLGLAHPNLASESGLTGNSRNYTRSTTGDNRYYNFDANNDNDQTIGSADDIRGDDENLHWYRKDNNNPFSIQSMIDTSTYSRSLADLPSGDSYVANADRDVANLFKAPNSEAVMQQGSFVREIQRTLLHDDVATLQLAMSGKDESAGTNDDYSVNLIYGGISDAADCDINTQLTVNNQTFLAQCSVNGEYLGTNYQHARISTANIYLNANINWFFNGTPPCSESLQLIAGEWRMFSLPCQMGISTPNTVADILADNMTADNDNTASVYGTDWVVYEYLPATNNYHKLALTEAMQEGVGYWLITLDQGITVNVEGEYPSNLDQPLGPPDLTAWNLVGTPFRKDTDWADVQVIDTNGDVLSLIESDPAIAPNNQLACNTSHSSCIVASTAFRWNPTGGVNNTGAYDTLTLDSGSTLSAFDGLWVYAQKPGVALRIPMSSSERATP